MVDLELATMAQLFAEISKRPGKHLLINGEVNNAKRQVYTTWHTGTVLDGLGLAMYLAERYKVRLARMVGDPDNEEGDKNFDEEVEDEDGQ